MPSYQSSSFSVPGLLALKNFCSPEMKVRAVDLLLLGATVPWNFPSLELLFSGTFAPGSKTSELSFPGTFAAWHFHSGTVGKLYGISQNFVGG